MSYLPALPSPQPTLDDEPFWANLALRRLTFQACGSCGRFRHPPVPLCPHCQSTVIEWREAPPRGRIFTFTEVCYAAHDAVAAALPYNVSVVEFPECGGVRLITNVIGPSEEIAIGAEVELFWDEIEGQSPLPRFRLVGATESIALAGP